MISEIDIFKKAGLPDEIYSHLLLLAVREILHRHNDDCLEQNAAEGKLSRPANAVYKDCIFWPVYYHESIIGVRFVSVSFFEGGQFHRNNCLTSFLRKAIPQIVYLTSFLKKPFPGNVCLTSFLRNAYLTDLMMAA